MLKRICGNCVFWSPDKPMHAKCKACDDMRENFMPRDMNCPMCDAGMIYNKRDVYLRCPDCGSQFWPFVDGGTVKDMVREEFEKNLPCKRNEDISKGNMRVKSKVASGSKSSKKKKTAAKKKSTTQIYQELAGQPNKIKLRKVE